MRILISIALLLILSNNTVYSQQTKAQKDSTAKDLAPIPGKAIVYILRPSSFGGLIKMKITCDSIYAGSTKAGQYVYTILNPGHHVFTSKSENKATLEVDLEEGKIYYIKQEVLMGALFAETDLKQLDENEGKKYLKKCKISKDNELTN